MSRFDIDYDEQGNPRSWSEPEPKPRQAICKTCAQTFDLVAGHDCPGLMPKPAPAMTRVEELARLIAKEEGCAAFDRVDGNSLEERRDLFARAQEFEDVTRGELRALATWLDLPPTEPAPACYVQQRETGELHIDVAGPARLIVVPRPDGQPTFTVEDRPGSSWLTERDNLLRIIQRQTEANAKLAERHDAMERRLTEAMARIQHLEAALLPFATFAGASGFDRLPPAQAMTKGSAMARNQVTAGHFQTALRVYGDPRAKA